MVIDQHFWAVINTLQWSRDYDPDRVRQDLSAFTYAEYNHMCNQFFFAYHALLQKWGRWVEEYGHLLNPHPRKMCTSDVLSDVLTHIVGLGKEEYEKVMNNPSLVYARIENKEYEESFLYCWH